LVIKFVLPADPAVVTKFTEIVAADALMFVAVNLSMIAVTPPRVPLIDPRTGLIDRAWFLFFLSLNTAANEVNDNPDVGPNVASLLAAYDATLQALTQEVGSAPSTGTAELAAQVDNIRQELQVMPRAELGTMSQLQQANVPWVTFDTTPESVPSGTPGTLYWDSADGNQTLSLVMINGVTTQQIGEEQYYRIKADSTITEGQVVMFTGTVGASGALKGAPATGLTANTALYTMGVATENIATNGWGYVTSFGLVRGIDTTGGLVIGLCEAAHQFPTLPDTLKVAWQRVDTRFIKRLLACNALLVHLLLQSNLTISGSVCSVCSVFGWIAVK